jgi:hypothetical protein
MTIFITSHTSRIAAMIASYRPPAGRDGEYPDAGQYPPDERGDDRVQHAYLSIASDAAVPCPEITSRSSQNWIRVALRRGNRHGARLPSLDRRRRT